MEEKTLFSTQEVAALLGVSDAHIRRLVGKGMAIPVGRIGKHSYVFNLAEIERLKHRNKVGGRRPAK